MFQRFCTHGIRDRRAGRPWLNSFLATTARQASCLHLLSAVGKTTRPFTTITPRKAKSEFSTRKVFSLDTGTSIVRKQNRYSLSVTAFLTQLSDTTSCPYRHRRET